MKNINLLLENSLRQNDIDILTTEIEVLPGINGFKIINSNEMRIEFDESKITIDKITSLIAKLGYPLKEGRVDKPNIKEHTYSVNGMHCASCELLIEKKLLELRNIKSVEAKADKGEVIIEYSEHKPSEGKLNHLFKKENYTFFDQPTITRKESKNQEFLIIFGIAILIIIGFLSLNKFGLSGLVSVNSTSSLPAFFIFGILAGISSCAALVGGIVLSMSKQWLGLYSTEQSTWQKLQPHLMFNSGRLLSYTFFGFLLGLIGSKLNISLRFTSLLIIAVSAMMVFLALQMLGVKSFRKFQFTLPKFITRYIANETNFKGEYMPGIMGALTFFLPCGFTITAQGLALISGNPLQGSLIMLFFALGTAPTLLAIGLSSVKFFSRPHLALRFSKIAGILVLFFALFNFNNQLNVLGITSFNDLFVAKADSKGITDTSDLPPLVDGKQVLKMNASSSGYSPNYLKVRASVPVRWEITDTGTSGCTNAVISSSLFSGQIDLTPGQVSVKEFTAPSQPGKYKFSCWMGMITGVMEVVDSSTSANPNSLNNNLANSTAGNTNQPQTNPSQGSCGGSSGGCGCGGGKRPVINQQTTQINQNENNVQLIKATYTKADDVQPNNITVKAGMPVRLELNPKEDATGCMSTIMIPGFYNTPQQIRAGQPIVMEFTPTQAGDYLITCAMNVPHAYLKVTN